MLLETKTSVRVPMFYGPLVLATALLLVSAISTSVWNNFYLVQARSSDMYMKAGTWGVCSFLENATGVEGPNHWCSDRVFAYTFNMVYDQSGAVEFPRSNVSDVMLGLQTPNSNQVVTEILGPQQTSGLWLNVVSACLCGLAVVSLMIQPRWIGGPDNPIVKFQKSGLLTVFITLVSCIITLASFAYTLSVARHAYTQFNKVPTLTAATGNIMWYDLACFFLQIPPIVSVFMT